MVLKEKSSFHKKLRIVWGIIGLLVIISIIVIVSISYRKNHRKEDSVTEITGSMPIKEATVDVLTDVPVSSDDLSEKEITDIPVPTDKASTEEMDSPTVISTPTPETTVEVETKQYIKRFDLSFGAESGYQLVLSGEKSGEEDYSGYHLISVSIVKLSDEMETCIQKIDLDTIAQEFWLDDFSKTASMQEDGCLLIEDLNFDGYQDFAIQGWLTNANIPYFCFLYDPVLEKYYYSFSICNIKVDQELKLLISENVRSNAAQYYTTYYGIDLAQEYVFKRVVIDNYLPDGTSDQIDLTYIHMNYAIHPSEFFYENLYTSSALIYLAERGLNELYEWTGTKVNSCCFNMSEFGDINYALTEEDIYRDRMFFSRSFPSENFEAPYNYNTIPHIWLTSGRRLWYSPVLQNFYPTGYDTMTPEEIILYFFKLTSFSNGETPDTIELSLENDESYIIKTVEGNYYEATFDPVIREVSCIYGPYDSYPQH